MPLLQVPMWMKVEEVDATRGVTVTHNGFLKFQHQNNLRGKRRFIPPHTIRYPPLPQRRC